VFHHARRAFEKYNIERFGEGGQQLSYPQLYLAGAAAGLANSVVSGPVEHIRTRLQTQGRGSARLYSGPSDCIRQIVQKSGYSGLYKGQLTAVARELQAYGLYFATFEACMRAIAVARDEKRENLSTWVAVPCGALAGVAFWVGCYPLDVVKSKLQSDGFGPAARYRNTWAVFVETWQHGKVKGFFRGLAPTLIRTMLSSGGCLSM